jgi:hypothetical protein
MENKKGMEVLVKRLQHLCLDYQAYRHIAKHSLEPHMWAVFLNDYRKNNEFRVFALFGEVNEDLQNDQPDTLVFQSLLKALEKVTL